jgi:hypothetical protein
MCDSTDEHMRSMNEKNCERLAVVVTGPGISKILGIPKIYEGTGKEQANNVTALLNEWKISNNVVCLGFDTTASNTGKTREIFINYQFLITITFIFRYPKWRL